MLKEVCVENFTDIPRVIELGADRIELNDNLAVGGTTPSFSVIKQAVKYTNEKEIPLVVMIRPRGGNFVYNEGELQMMKEDLQVAALLGVKAVAFGCLTAENHLAKEQMASLIGLAQSLNLTVVMHMAFDAILVSEQKEALEWLAARGVKRILTHGGSLTVSIEKCLPHLREIMTWAKDKLEILPGGSINAVNCTQIATVLGVTQLHGTKIIKMN